MEEKELDLEKDLGSLALPDDDLFRRGIAAMKWVAEMSPETSGLFQSLGVAELVYQPRKTERVFRCLVGLYDRVQKTQKTIEKDYVRREEFVDVLEECLRAVARDPDIVRRKRYETLLASIMTIKSPDRGGPEENLMVIRLAHELSVAHLKLLVAHEGDRTNDENMISRTEILRRRASAPHFDHLIEDLIAFRLMDPGVLGTVATHGPLTDGLTPIGRRLVQYLHE